MGIELPTPSANGSNHNGEAHVAPQTAERQSYGNYGAERTAGSQNVESFATERLSSQEVRNGQGAGDGFTQAPQNDATATTNDPAQAAATVSAAPLDDVPVVAADEDLIEKQWVDSVKQTIKNTRTDPYKQSEAISRLQADYLQKRYGKTLADGGA